MTSQRGGACVRAVNSVTTPATPPPPPRMAQKRSCVFDGEEGRRQAIERSRHHAQPRARPHGVAARVGDDEGAIGKDDARLEEVRGGGAVEAAERAVAAAHPAPADADAVASAADDEPVQGGGGRWGKGPWMGLRMASSVQPGQQRTFPQPVRRRKAP